LKQATSTRRPWPVSLTPNPVSSRSGSDANMTFSPEDLFGHQRQTWAACPDLVQTMILKNIRKTIKAKMQQEHRLREDRRKGFTDKWAAVAAEVQSQISSRAPTRATPQIQSQTPSNLGIGALAAPRVTNSIHKNQSHLSISASQQRDSSAFSIPIHRPRTAHRRWPWG